MALNGRDFSKGPWVETPGDQLLPVLPADAKVTKVGTLKDVAVCCCHGFGMF